MLAKPKMVGTGVKPSVVRIKRKTVYLDDDEEHISKKMKQAFTSDN